MDDTENTNAAGPRVRAIMRLVPYYDSDINATWSGICAFAEYNGVAYYAEFADRHIREI